MNTPNSTPFQMYRKKALQSMRPYVVGEDMTGISVAATDTPEAGGMIAVNANDPADKWYVAAKFFADNYEPAYPGPDTIPPARSL